MNEITKEMKIFYDTIEEITNWLCLTTDDFKSFREELAKTIEKQFKVIEDGSYFTKKQLEKFKMIRREFVNHSDCEAIFDYYNYYIDSKKRKEIFENYKFKTIKPELYYNQDIKLVIQIKNLIYVAPAFSENNLLYNTDIDTSPYWPELHLAKVKEKVIKIYV